MIRKPISARLALFLGILSVVLLLAGYIAVSRVQHIKNPGDTTIPSMSQLAEGVRKIIAVNERSGERWLLVDSAATAGRLFFGLLCGAAVAVIAGILMGCFSAVESLLLPPLSLLAKIPPTAALAVFFVIVGTGREMYIAMIAFGIMPTMAQSVYLAVRDVPDELLHKGYTLGASQSELIWNIIVQMILPKIIDAVRLQIGPAMVYLIAAEMVVGDVGFGYRIRLQSRLLNMNTVYPYLAILAVFGFMMDFGLKRLQKAWCPWYEHESR